MSSYQMIHLLILLFHNHLISASVLYPSFHRIVEQLSFDSTLPQCTLSSCEKTEKQANFSAINLTDEDSWRLASYHRSNSSHGPFLIASTGIYQGKRLKYRNNRFIDQFLGIYYAETPQSLQKPIKKRFNYSISSAKKFSPCCMQSLVMTENLSYGSFLMQNRFDANCLALNIYRADLRYGEKRKAIMVFSHGGSNQIGGGSLFDGSILASEGDIIVITMNFRLNYHGFLSSGDHRMRGNYGLWDQLLAVEWIYENAHLFGGDPHRITLAGHSAGAGNAMLIPASRYCRNMVKRVISQSGSGLALWSVNHQPIKLIERLSREFHCQSPNETEMFQCVSNLLQDESGDLYRLHLNLSIADDNPYPVVDQDFLNDTLENLLQSDVYRNVDFLTGVTLNEGLYFAEYHIGNFYSDLNHRFSNKKKRSIPQNSTGTIPPDIVINKDDQKMTNGDDQYKSSRRTQAEHPLHYDSSHALKQFSKLNYIEQYIKANFKHGVCFLKDIKKRYEYPGKNNITIRLKLYVDLVSDLMFNFHLVRSLNLRTQVASQTSSNYAYIYSHRPTFKARSLLRDHLKTLPNVVGHFAELDYVFGVPLARDFPRIHRNVNMTYYNYSDDEVEFSQEIIRYWSNFIKTGNPNVDSARINTPRYQWKPYTNDEHNYIFFQLNNIHTEKNYFDSVYEFWWNCFQTESTGGCRYEKITTRMKKHLLPFSILLLALLLIIILYAVCKHYQNKERHRTSHDVQQYPSFVTS